MGTGEGAQFDSNDVVMTGAVPPGYGLGQAHPFMTSLGPTQYPWNTTDGKQA